MGEHVPKEESIVLDMVSETEDVCGESELDNDSASMAGKKKNKLKIEI